jgi:hypothetical protein
LLSLLKEEKEELEHAVMERAIREILVLVEINAVLRERGHRAANSALPSQLAVPWS